MVESVDSSSFILEIVARPVSPPSLRRLTRSDRDLASGGAAHLGKYEHAGYRLIITMIATALSISIRDLSRPSNRVRVVFWLSAITCGYATLALLLPIDTRSPIMDEPIFAQSAFEWARSGAIEISGLSAPNAVFDTIWGGMFARVFGETYYALRFSTLVLTAMSAPFMYWTCRLLGADRAVSLLATAAYLLSPLVIVLSATFMTDAHFMALVVMSVAFYLYGLNATSRNVAAFLAGSALASLAFLSRPQALVIPAATVLVVAFRSVDRAKALKLMSIVILPVFVFVWHAAWTRQVGEPFIRDLSTRFLSEGVIPDSGYFAGRLVMMASVYLGMLTLALLPVMRFKKPMEQARPLLAVGLSLGLAALYLAMMANGYDPTGRQSFMTPHGLGALERSVLGERPHLWPGWVQGTLGFLAVISTYVWVSNAAGRWRRSVGGSKWLLLLVGGGLILAAVAAAMTLHSEIFDRYWLPVIPLVIAVAAATAESSPTKLATATLCVAAVGLFGVLGTYDSLNAHSEVVAFAEDSVRELGVSPLEFEGGAAWSAVTFGVTDDGPQHILNRNGPFWVRFYAVHTRPEYGVALEPIDGYEILGRREFPSILHFQRTFVYLVRGNPDMGYFIDADDF